MLVRTLVTAGLLVAAQATGRAAAPEASAPKSPPADTTSQTAGVGKSDAGGKSDAPPAAKAERGTTTEAVAPAPDKAAGAADDTPQPKAARPKAHKSASSGAGPDKPNAKIGEGGSPASPPPMTMSGLRDEVRREATPGKIDPASPPRTKVEQMLAEITRARESLHDDTTRLEAMMMQDAADAPVSGAATQPGQPAKAVAKNPLDVLAKALRGIKPEQAAPIVARLDRRLAANVLLHMPPIDAGKIMGALKPDTAAELATQITMRVPHAEQKR